MPTLIAADASRRPGTCTYGDGQRWLPAEARSRLAFFREGLVTPSPPGVAALDVQQELRHRPPVRRYEAHRLTDAAVGGLPRLRVLISAFGLPQLVIEQRPDVREPGRRPDPS